MHTPQNLSLIVLTLMLVQAGAGLLFPDQYRDADWIRLSWFGNDAVTLALAVPLLALGIAGARRGSVRGLLLWLGGIGYAIYNALFYLLGAALNSFFLLYVVTLVAAVLTLVLGLVRLNPAAVAARVRPSLPARLVGGVLAAIGAMLAVVWTAMWAAHVFAGRPTPVEPEAFRLVAALDLSLMVPALVGGGALLWMRRAWGFLIAAMTAVQGALYLLVLSVNSWLAIARGLSEAPGELPLWGTLTLVTAGAATLLLAYVDPEPVAFRMKGEAPRIP